MSQSTLQDFQDSGVECHDCGKSYKGIGKHWSLSDCLHPRFTDHQKDVLVGLLMGDGCADMGSANACLTVGMITKEYLDYLDDLFGELSIGVDLQETGEKTAEKAIESGFSPNADKSEYSDVYRWRTRRHPYVTKLREWYDSGSKVFPPDIELTPTVLKHWYVSDGHYSDKGGSRRICMGIANEAANREKINSYFRRVDLPAPDWWSDTRCDWDVEHSIELFEYMGTPPQGFKYKWPTRYHD